MPTITTVEEFDEALEIGPYADGGYPIFFLMSDGETMSPKAAAAEAETIRDAIREHSTDGWRVVGYDVNWEDETMMCCNTNERIPAAYGDD